ncbi:phage antirepressor N-terminal domain-containing protein [Morganella morganii]|uniref:phage antirepressor N-terminal domain-containing protein n=1 Tax=Morganella morganii TaxID=582 RepID=UPI001C437F4C|nr:phage antirepressor N-terminal domain-containing protein [Morganella morganii]QXO48971.1 phage antirepressor N-terminal domain-containing protein [Morganella morganii]HDU8566431.1 phage antirepressor N-terminal domain-containing protein [Morganella morganii]
MTSISTINVPFHGDNLYVVNYNGQPYVPMKPIVEGMGLDWMGQYRKLTQRFAKGIEEMSIPTKGGEQSMLCLALRKLAGWLHTISPNKVKPEIRDKVIRYQEECDDVLYEYWTTGEVKKKPNFRQSTAKELIPLRQTAERLIAHGVGNIYPDIWKHVHAEFGVQHINELLPEQIPLAISYLDALEGEYIPKQEKAESKSRLDEHLLLRNLTTAYHHVKKIREVWNNIVAPAVFKLNPTVEAEISGRLADMSGATFSSLSHMQIKSEVKLLN